MSKSPFDLFKAISEAAKLVEDVSKAADKNSKKRGKRDLGPDDLIAGLAETISERVSSSRSSQDTKRQATNTHKGPKRFEEGWAKGEDMKDLAEVDRLIAEIDEVRLKVFRDYSKKKHAIDNALKLHEKRLKYDREVLLREPSSYGLLDPTEAEDFFADLSKQRVELKDELERISDELHPRYDSIIDAITKWRLGSDRRALSQRAQNIHASYLGRDRSSLGRQKVAIDQLARQLEELRTEIASSDHSQEKSSFDPNIPILRQFRMGMPLGEPDLVRIRAMIDAGWNEEFEALHRLPYKDVLNVSHQWKTEGMSESDVDFVIAVYEREVLFGALKQMGLNKANALKAKNTGARSKPSDRQMGYKLLEKLPEELPITTEAQIDRLIDALVLASEYFLPPPSTYTITSSLKEFEPVPVSGPDDVRRKHYLNLIERLEKSGQATIGKKQTKQTFLFSHLELLRRLRELVGLESPSGALIQWDSFQGSCEAKRQEIIETASSFWRPLLTHLIDRKGVIESEQAEANRQSLISLVEMDKEERSTVLLEAKRLLHRFDLYDFGMAVKVEKPKRVDAPLAQSPPQLLREVVTVLLMSDRKRKKYFEAPPEVPELGGFRDLVTQFRIDRHHLSKGPFGTALQAQNLSLAEDWVMEWLDKAPPSDLRESLRSFDFSRMTIESWAVFDDFFARSYCAVIGLDLSEHIHCEITVADQSVPLEIAVYPADVFPDSDVSADLIRSYASGRTIPWQGRFADLSAGLPIMGMAPLILALRAFDGERRGNWGRELLAYHNAMLRLAEAFIFLQVNKLVSKELERKSHSLDVPVILGTHDFGVFGPVVYTTG